jgi:DNA-binding PadR family transcriptional regulator
MKTSLIIAALLLLGLFALSATPLIRIELGQPISRFSIICAFALAHPSNEVEEVTRFPDNGENDTIESKALQETRKRILKAVLAPAILAQLAERRFLSATNIIELLRKQHGIKLSSGTVYPILYKLEREGKIKRVPNRMKMLWVLNGKGKETVSDLQEIVKKLQNIIDEFTK